MSLNELLRELSELGVKLWSEGENLRVKAPKDSLTPELRDLLRLRKTELLAVLAQPAPTEQIAPIPRISEGNSSFPLSFAQQRLWFLGQLEGPSATYNIPMALRLAGALDVAALQHCLDRIVQRHEVLRTHFAMMDGMVVQIIAPHLEIPLPFIDLQPIGESLRETELQRFVIHEAQQPFDVSENPLWRVTLLRLTDDEHVLLLTMHHIISDDRSVNVLVKEVAALYHAYITDTPAALPELPIQYADFAHWQRQWLTGEALQTQVNYWKEQLDGAPPLLELPTDHPRPSVQSFRGSQLSFSIPAELTQKLQELSRQQGTTLFMTLLGAYAMLLSRYSGQQDIVIGSPIANRNRSEIESLIGFFVNTLALRVDVSDNPSFEQLLQRVRQVALGAYGHQDLPFEKLTEELKPERSLSHSPIFQVMLVLLRPLEALELQDLRLEPLESKITTAKFDLTLGLQETANGLVGSWEYNSDLFEQETIIRLNIHFQMLLENIVAEPEQQIQDLPLLTAVERQQLLYDFNDTTTEFPSDLCVHQLFERQVDRTPDAIALVYEQQQVTYRQLNQKANQLAHHLQSLGVGPEVIVGLCVERSIDMVVGLLGILKAGGAYLPLDPSYPQERLAFMIEDAQANTLLTQKHLSEKLSAHSARTIVYLDDSQQILTTQSVDNLTIAATAERLAYVIYTSGSTGTPKGTLNTHRGLFNRIYWMQQLFQLDCGDRVLQKTPFSFDVSVWEFVWPLMSGACLVVVPPHMHRDPVYIAQLVIRKQITTIHFVPSMLQVFMEHPESSGCQELRRVMCSGEALSQSLQQRFFDVLPDAELHNLYGPTEAAIDVTHWRCSSQAELQSVPIGAPIANTQMYVLDEQRQPVPIGVAGELYIGGAAVARGYLNRPELTAEKFINNPFSDGRLYKTGDLGRWRVDGQLEYIGRMDHQVKLRGFRIELGEIESTLCQHLAIAQAVVLLKGESVDDKHLVAYVVSTENEAISLEQLREHLKTKLPEYMLPALFVVLEELPLTVNGKIDRKALSALEGLELSATIEYVPPQTPTQELMAQVWSEVLKREQVGIHDNFFELGGHSLLATQLISRVRDVFQVELPPRTLFEQPTVAGLAQELQQGEQAAPPIVSVPRDNQLPLSFAQQRLWFLAQLEGPSATYNIPMALRLTGSLDVAALEHCLARIVQRHEVLRTHFAIVDGSAVQRIAPHLAVPLPRIDLRGLSESSQQLEVQRLITQEAQQSFDLSTGPLLRVTLLCLAPEEHVLMLTMHHIISDGWSLGVLVQEVSARYQAYITDTPAALPELPIQYADFAHWQRQWLQGEVLQSQVDYWKEQLAGAPPLLELPTYHPRPAIQSFRGSYLSFGIPAALSQKLEELSRQHGVTLFMTLLGAYAILLSRYSGQQDMVIGSPIANRNRGETENLIGFFVNTLALRIDLSGDLTVEQLLERVRKVALGAYAHQDLPFEKLVEELQPQRSLSHSPIFQLMFILQNAPMEALDLQDLQLESWGNETTVAKFDLTLYLEETSNGLVGSWEYNSDLFEQENIERLNIHFQMLLEGIVAEPEQQIQDLPLLTAVECKQLLYDFNDTTVEFPSDLCIHQSFEQQVEKTPDAIALVHEQQQLTYRQLNQRANQLAHYLQSLDVGPDAVVGLCVERSLDMVVGLLGILKAGGAYLPLDPAYPQERLAFMIEDSNASLVLSEHSVASVLSSSSAQILLFDELQPTLDALSKQTPICTADPGHLAYVIYTSGSTGMPKGVMVEQRNAIALITWAIDHFDSIHLQAVLASTSICFDLSVFELFAPLSCGGYVLLVSDALALLKRQLPLWPSLLNTVPSAAAALLDAGRLPESVQVVNLAGEALSPTLVQQLYQLPTVEQVYNLYGPSEDTTYSSWALMEREADYCPIGRPVANTRVYVLDEQRQPVPIGVAGELHIGGAGVTRGYLNRPELTAEKFIVDPFSDKPDARFYRTGDLGRWRTDGQLEYLGRIDNQVKLRGFRIELGEIEAVLCKHPAVQQTAVTVKDEQAENKQLVAYVVPTEDETISLEPLREYLKSKLPEYMVPALFIELEALPLTVNGKVDRKALPVAEGLELNTTAQYVPPQTPTQELLAQLWSEVLKRERVGIHDNFFELGGHSLLATQLISRTGDTFGVELSLRALFEKPTIADLSAFLEQPDSDINPSSSASIHPISRDSELVLSHAQQRMWFLNQLEPDNPFYNIAAAVRMKGVLDIAALRYSLSAVMKRHEALRTTFPCIDGRAVQKITSELILPLPLIDLAALSKLEKDSTVRQLATAEADQFFDLEQGPLVRVSLLQLGEAEHVLMLTMHHIISDGWSIGLLTEELASLYKSFTTGEPTLLTPLRIQYVDYAHWQSQWLQGKILQTKADYWKHQLDGAPVSLNLPTDHPRSPKQSVSGARLQTRITKNLVESLCDFSNQQDATMFMTMLTVLKLVLFKWTQQSDLVVGTVIANRNKSEIERIIGCFINFLPLRSRVVDSETGLEFLRSVKLTVLEAFLQQDYPFDEIVKAVSPNRQNSPNPIYNVAFLLQNYPHNLYFNNELEIEIISVPTRNASIDLRVIAEEDDRGISLCWEYNSDLFDEETIEYLNESYLKILNDFVQFPEKKIIQFSISEELELKATKNREVSNQRNLVITSTFTADPIQDSLSFWAKKLGIFAKIECAPYNQVFQQLLDPSSLLSRNQSGVNIVLLRLEDMKYGDNLQLSGQLSEGDLKVVESNILELAAALRSSSERSLAPCLVCICPPSTAFGANRSFEQLEKNVESAMKSINGVSLITTSDIGALYKVSEYYDPYGDEVSNVPYTPLFFAILGTFIARRIYSLQQPPRKVIVLDCDQTLWDKFCAEDDWSGIEISPIRRRLQEFIVKQCDLGKLICLCSKNNEDDVIKVFKNRSDMYLTLDHIVSRRINWKSKSENIKSMAEELQLGTDSFVFIDDSVIECAEVRANCPEVLTLQLPSESEDIPTFLENIWALDNWSVSNEDRARTIFYKQNTERELLRRGSQSLNSFLESLSLKVKFSKLDPNNLSRVSQLTQRVNQFNFTGVRRSESEIKKLIQLNELRGLVVEVSDRFGSYGIVGVILFSITSNSSIDVDTFLLSCRVLGRRVEHQMLNKLIKTAKELDLNYISIHCTPNRKNIPAVDFLNSVGLAFRETATDGYIFTFPTNFSIVLAFNSKDSIQRSSEKVTFTQAVSQSNGAVTSNESSLMCHIATDLCKAEHILSAIESEKVWRPGLCDSPLEPRNPDEEKVLEIWKQLLKITQVGIYDNFFELGGNSLLATQLISRVHKMCQVKIPLVDFFEEPTVAGLSEHIAMSYVATRPLQDFTTSAGIEEGEL
jgi:amino acid adenylation domain-containing protein/FkbH-like protein